MGTWLHSRQAACHLHAVHIGQTQVENDDVGMFAGDSAECLFPAGGFQDDELAAQGGFQKAADGALIINNKDFKSVSAM